MIQQVRPTKTEPNSSLGILNMEPCGSTGLATLLNGSNLKDQVSNFSALAKRLQGGKGLPDFNQCLHQTENTDRSASGSGLSTCRHRASIYASPVSRVLVSSESWWLVMKLERDCLLGTLSRTFSSHLRRFPKAYLCQTTNH